MWSADLQNCPFVSYLGPLSNCSRMGLDLRGLYTCSHCFRRTTKPHHQPPIIKTLTLSHVSGNWALTVGFFKLFQGKKRCLTRVRHAPRLYKPHPGECTSTVRQSDFKVIMNRTAGSVYPKVFIKWKSSTEGFLHSVSFISSSLIIGCIFFKTPLETGG